jgi:ribosome-associated protein YbcJ (S4-like RNA binding protein)
MIKSAFHDGHVTVADRTNSKRRKKTLEEGEEE